MGISPCHPVLKKYSFAYQLGIAKQDDNLPIGGIKTLDWNMTSAENVDLYHFTNSLRINNELDTDDSEKFIANEFDLT